MDCISKCRQDAYTSHDLLEKTLRALTIKLKFLNCSSSQLKMFTLQETLLRKRKGKLQIVRKYLQNMYLTKDSDPEYRNSSNNNNKKTTRFLKWVNYLYRHFIKDRQIAIYHMERCST